MYACVCVREREREREIEMFFCCPVYVFCVTFVKKNKKQNNNRKVPYNNLRFSGFQEKYVQQPKQGVLRPQHAR